MRVVGSLKSSNGLELFIGDAAADTGKVTVLPYPADNVVGIMTDDLPSPDGDIVYLEASELLELARIILEARAMLMVVEEEDA